MSTRQPTHPGRLARMFLFALLIFAFLGSRPVLAAPPSPEDQAALQWLRARQQPDGGFSSGMQPGSDIGTTVEVILAAAAAGENPATWQSAQAQSPLDYLMAQVKNGQVTEAAALSRTIIAAVAGGQDPHAFGGQDLVKALQASRDPQSGWYGDSLYAHAYALLALHNAGEPLDEQDVALLLAPRPPEGGWAMLGGVGADTADTNTTALAVQALIAAGKTAEAQSALPYLHQVQNADGGFPWQKPSAYGTDSDANSTAVVLQALNALGEDPADWAPAGTDPRAALQAFHDPQSGAYRWQNAIPDPNLAATAQTVQALEGLTLVQLPRVTEAGSGPGSSLPLLGLGIGGVVIVALGLYIGFRLRAKKTQ